MITQYRPSYYQSPRAPSFAGRSVDDKPLHVENGATFNEIDTGREFKYDAENNKWIEQEGATPVQPGKPEQTKTVDLNMADGNQTVSPDSGKTLSSVTVTKPATMIPANIKTGVNIGGVVGTLSPAKEEQAKTAALAMASGDQTVTPDAGKVLSSVKITKPATLIPANIKTGVDIGGVKGTLAPAKTEQTKTADLSMAEGNQVISADTGKVMTTVTVNKPETLIPANIKAGVNIGGVVGTASGAKEEQTKTVDLSMASGNQTISPDSGKVLSSVVVTKPATLVAGNIKSGVAIGGVTGTLSPAKAEETKTVDLSMASGDQTIAPTAGKVMTSVKVTKPATMVASNIKKGVTIGGVTGTYDNAPTGTYVEETYDASHALATATLHGYTFIRGFMFDNCPNLTTVTLCDTITSIGTQAFDGDKALTTVNLPSSLATIGSYAFRACAALATETLPASLVTVAMYAFQACAKVKFATLPATLTTIGKFAFHGCTGMTVSEIPASVTTIDEDAFYGCTGITSLTFKGTPTTIAATAFGGCTNLTEIKVPWAEGAVANAPWGATAATITYDYTGA